LLLNGKAAWSGFQQIWQQRDKSVREGDRWYRNVKAANGVFVRKRSRIRSSQKSGDGILLGARAGRDISRNWAKAIRGIEREKETIAPPYKIRAKSIFSQFSPLAKSLRTQGFFWA